jgi:hypothetical protein
LLLEQLEADGSGGEGSEGPFRCETLATNPDGPAALLATSGTTGAPKTFLLSHRNIGGNVRALADLGIIGAGDRVLLPLPLHHAYPLIVGMLTSLTVCSILVLPAGATGPVIMRAVREGTATDDDCLMELRWFYDRRDLAEVRRDLAAWLGKWQGKSPKQCGWVEDNIEETLTFYRLPLAHYKHMKSTNMLERLNQEIERRTHVVRIFPNAASCLRLVRALAVEAHENWLEAIRYLQESTAIGMIVTMRPPLSALEPLHLRPTIDPRPEHHLNR